jgi:hypothetical protein
MEHSLARSMLARAQRTRDALSPWARNWLPSAPPAAAEDTPSAYPSDGSGGGLVAVRAAGHPRARMVQRLASVVAARYPDLSQRYGSRTMGDVASVQRSNLALPAAPGALQAPPVSDQPWRSELPRQEAGFQQPPRPLQEADQTILASQANQTDQAGETSQSTSEESEVEAPAPTGAELMALLRQRSERARATIQAKRDAEADAAQASRLPPSPGEHPSSRELAPASRATNLRSGARGAASALPARQTIGPAGPIVRRSARIEEFSPQAEASAGYEPDADAEAQLGGQRPFSEVHLAPPEPGASRRLGPAAAGGRAATAPATPSGQPPHATTSPVADSAAVSPTAMQRQSQYGEPPAPSPHATTRPAGAPPDVRRSAQPAPGVTMRPGLDAGMRADTRADTPGGPGAYSHADNQAPIDTDAQPSLLDLLRQRSQRAKSALQAKRDAEAAATRPAERPTEPATPTARELPGVQRRPLSSNQPSEVPPLGTADLRSAPAAATAAPAVQPARIVDLPPSGIADVPSAPAAGTAAPAIQRAPTADVPSAPAAGTAAPAIQPARTADVSSAPAAATAAPAIQPARIADVPSATVATGTAPAIQRARTADVPSAPVATGTASAIQFARTGDVPSAPVATGTAPATQPARSADLPPSGTADVPSAPVAGKTAPAIQRARIADVSSAPAAATAAPAIQPARIADVPSAPVAGRTFPAIQPARTADVPSAPVAGESASAFQPARIADVPSAPVAGRTAPAIQPAGIADVPSAPAAATAAPAIQPAGIADGPSAPAAATAAPVIQPARTADFPSAPTETGTAPGIQRARIADVPPTSADGEAVSAIQPSRTPVGPPPGRADVPFAPVATGAAPAIQPSGTADVSSAPVAGRTAPAIQPSRTADLSPSGTADVSSAPPAGRTAPAIQASRPPGPRPAGPAGIAAVTAAPAAIAEQAELAATPAAPDHHGQPVSEAAYADASFVPPASREPQQPEESRVPEDSGISQAAPPATLQRSRTLDVEPRAAGTAEPPAPHQAAHPTEGLQSLRGSTPPSLEKVGPADATPVQPWSPGPSAPASQLAPSGGPVSTPAEGIATPVTGGMPAAQRSPAGGPRSGLGIESTAEPASPQVAGSSRPSPAAASPSTDQPGAASAPAAPPAPTDSGAAYSPVTPGAAHMAIVQRAPAAEPSSTQEPEDAGLAPVRALSEAAPPAVPAGRSPRAPERVAPVDQLSAPKVGRAPEPPSWSAEVPPTPVLGPAVAAPSVLRFLQRKAALPLARASSGPQAPFPPPHLLQRDGTSTELHGSAGYVQEPSEPTEEAAPEPNVAATYTSESSGSATEPAPTPPPTGHGPAGQQQEPAGGQQSASVYYQHSGSAGQQQEPAGGQQSASVYYQHSDSPAQQGGEPAEETGARPSQRPLDWAYELTPIDYSGASAARPPLPLATPQAAAAPPPPRAPSPLAIKPPLTWSETAADATEREDESAPSPNLDDLARQILPRVKRMLAIERERRPAW